MPIRCWPGMTVPGKRKRHDPNTVIRGTMINTYISGGASCVQLLNREKKVRGLNGHKSHVHTKPGPSKDHIFSKVKAHGAIEHTTLMIHIERARVLSLQIDRVEDETTLDRMMHSYVELVSKLTKPLVQRLIDLEGARGVVRARIVLRQLEAVQ